MSETEARPQAGIVYLVGAGPGDPGLLTLRAAELLRIAQVVAHDELVSPEILALAPPTAERLAVGRRQGSGRIDYRLHPAVLERAQRGLRVVRLKSGDPLIFGRGGEEAEELAENGIPFEIIPGISAALGAAAYAGIPLTHRHVSAGVLLTTGHEADDAASGRAGAGAVLVAPRVPGASPAQDRTLVLYMAARRVRPTLQRLIKEGFAADTPSAYVAAATTPSQEVVVGTLADLADHLPPASSPPSSARPPGLLIIGEVVRLRAKLAWFEKRHPSLPGRPVGSR